MQGIDVSPEESPVGEHQSNGAIESGVRELEKQIRIIKDAVEEKYGMLLESNHPILAWIIEHAGASLTRYAIGKDGRTAWQRAKGKQWKVALPAYGEGVFYMPVRHGGRLEKLKCKWEEGIFAGIYERTGELLVMTEGGVFRTRNIRRRAPSERWNKELLAKVTGLPWATRPGSGEREVLPASVRIEVDKSIEIPDVGVA